MKVVLCGGGVAGRMAAVRLAASLGDHLAGLVWDEATGPPPELASVPRLSLETCSGAAEVLLCSGFGRIIPSAVLAAFPGGAFNAHPSLLPHYRGRHAIQWAIASGERVLGVTIHRMTVRLDQGEIIAAAGWRFGLEEAYPQIAECLARLAGTMLAELARRLVAGEAIEPLAPEPAKGRYWPRRRPEDSRIDWSQGQAVVLNQVRAGDRSYPAHAYLQDGQKVNFVDYLAGGQPGEVLFSSPQGCLIATADGVVWLVPDRPLKKGEVLS